MNCKFQINLLSSLGYYGKDILKFTDKLLKMDYVDFVGSDIHNLNHINMIKSNRKVKLKEIEKLKEAIGRNNFFSG